MEWRCEWCGKPHEADDPPCDNCGHGKFEKAIVRQTAPEGDQESMTVWVCTDCGREHPKHNPPCSRCTNATLERREVSLDDVDLTAPPTDANTGPTYEAEVTTVWVCTECGREHPKNSPPCSRCANATLEEQRKRIDESELAVPTYLDVLTPKYAAALIGLFLIVVVFGLGAAGIVDVPGVSDGGVPGVDNVPGNSSTADGVSLSAAEGEYVAAMNERRERSSAPVYDRSDTLDAVATYYNQKRVKQLFADGSAPNDSAVEGQLDNACHGPHRIRTVSIHNNGYDSSESIATRFADGVLEQWGIGSSSGMVGVDIHSVEGQLFLTHVDCE